MKKITLFFLLLTAYFGYAQPTTDPTTPPVRNTTDVISIFSGAYTDVSGSDFNPNWSQSGFGSANTAYNTGSGNLVLAYPSFNYQGIQFGSAQNISAMEFLHVDIYVNGSFNPNVYVISSGAEIAHSITNSTPNTWISVDIAVPGITGDTSNAIQFKFDGGNGSTDAIYVDNLYFWKAAANPATDATLSDLQVDGATINGFGAGTTSYTYTVPTGTVVVPQITTATTTQAGAGKVITQASGIPGTATVLVTATDNITTKTYTVSIVELGPGTAAPTPPARAVADVFSIYSDAYATGPTFDNFDAGWCGTATEGVMIGGNNTLHKINAAGCHGIDFSSNKVDLSSFTHLHFDFYIADTDLVGDVFNLKLVDFGGGGAETSSLQVNINGGTTPQLVADTWVSVDVDITAIGGVVAGSTTRTDIAQIGITTANVDNVWYDNIYLHKNTTLGIEDKNLVSFKAYPNPTRDNWTIKSGNNTQIKSVKVFDVLGNTITTMTPNNSEAVIDASKLSSGLYFAKVQTAVGLQSLRLVKN